MNNLSHTIRRFNRFELKYILTIKQAAQFKEQLRAYLTQDEHSNEDGRYHICNLYYDSPDYRCYQEKMDGCKSRRKLRLRHYVTDEDLTEETPIFVEIKQRIDRVTQKRRVLLPYREALLLCNDRNFPDESGEEPEVLEEIYAFIWQYNLISTIIIHYERQAFIGTDYDIGLRVTFDTDLTFQSDQLYLHAQSTHLPMLNPHLVVMEVKVNERIPDWLTQMIAFHNLQIDRVSKYCLSIEAAGSICAANINPYTRLRPQLAERSNEVLGSIPSIFHPFTQKMEVGKN
jgi:SPX domain protein involved in polyphosphate accumulation